ncbi:MAG: FHA domain-containing protein [Candidatus Pacebacteria bacterium]|nr:FHA domain-containing protein [Candidatus Paceibacterota bacterium]
MDGSTFNPGAGLVKIGRTKDCNIVIDCESMSRCQCSMYMGKAGWVIADGDGSRPSRNGTWYPNVTTPIGSSRTRCS